MAKWDLPWNRKVSLAFAISHYNSLYSQNEGRNPMIISTGTDKLLEKIQLPCIIEIFNTLEIE